MPELMTSQSILEKIKTRLSVPVAVVLVTIGIFLFGGAALMAIKQYQASQLPTAKPLTDGTYAPAQVVFKIKPGKNKDAALEKALRSSQTVYRDVKTKKLVSKFDPNVAKNPKRYQKQSLALHLKQARQLFPQVKISDDVRKKILQRNGAKDPDVTYKRLGMDRWNVVEVNEPDADVAQLVQRLKADAGNIEVAEPNGIAKLEAISQGDVDPGVITGGGGTATTCSNPNDPYSCKTGDVPGASTDQWGLSAIHYQQAWQFASSIPPTRPKPIIAVLDSGVDMIHADVRDILWKNAGEDINHNGCAEYWSSTDYSGHIDCHGNTVYTGGDLDGVDNDGNGYTDDLNGMNFQNATYIDKGWAVNTNDGPTDDHGHGTLVASIAAAHTDNSEGMAGICPSCTTMSLRTIGLFSGPRSGAEGTVEQFAKAIIYAADNGADVINISASMGPSQAGNIYLLDNALTYAYDLGVVTVAASGNCNEDFGGSLPASNQYVIAVGGIDLTGQRYVDLAQPSSQCQILTQGTFGSSYGQNLALVAPEIAIMGALGHRSDSTALPMLGLSLIGSSPNLAHYGAVPYVDPTLDVDALIEKLKSTFYQYSSGTSFSAPIVSGVAGLVRAINPALGVDDVRHLLTDTATHMPNVRDENGNIVTLAGDWNKYAGYGLVNAQAAVQQTSNSIPDLAPERDYSMAETIGTNVLRLRTSITNLNPSIYGVSRILVRFTDQNNTTLYEETVDHLAGVWGRVSISYDKTINGSMPASVNVIVDPLYKLVETNTVNNTLANVPVVPFGTPMFSQVAPQRLTTGQTTNFSVSATTSAAVDPASIQYQMNSYPAGAQFTNNVFTWTPASDTPAAVYDAIFTAIIPQLSLSNTLTVPIYYNVTTQPPDPPGAKPDLTFTHPYNGYPVKATRFDATRTKVEFPVSNKGTGAAQNVTYVIAFISGSFPTETLLYSGMVPSVPANTTIFQEVWVPIPYDIPERTWIRVKLDPINAIPESDEGNNWGDVFLEDYSLFSLAIEGGNFTLKAGFSTAATARVISQNGFSGNVALAISASNPTITSFMFNPTMNVPNDGSATSMFTIGTTTSTPSGSHTVIVTATANGQIKTVRIPITITPNSPPVLSPIGPKTAYKGTVFSLTTSATDPDDTTLTYSANNLPPGATFNSGTHQMNWLLSGTGTFIAYYDVTFTVRDPAGASDSETVRISVATLSSFLPGTRILLADYISIPIEQIRSGQSVLSYDERKNTMVPATVAQVFQHTADEYFVINDHVSVTAKHPILTSDGWRLVETLTVGSRLRTPQGEEVVKSIVTKHQPVQVYNFMVEPTHTYVAEGIIVHNKPPVGRGGVLTP